MRKNKWKISILLVIALLASMLFTNNILAAEEPVTGNLALKENSEFHVLEKNYGIDSEELVKMQTSGMSVEEISAYLQSVYPIQGLHNLSGEEYLELARETGISKIEALKCYEIAFKWSKDPYFIVDLYKDTGDWAIIEQAFMKRAQVKDISILNLISSIEISREIAAIYNIDYNQILTLLNNGATIDDIADILFFAEITLEVKRSYALSKSQYFNDRLDLKIDGPLPDNWLDELPEEIQYLRAEWPERSFSSEFLLSDSSKTTILNQNVFLTPQNITMSTNETNLLDKGSFYSTGSLSPYNSYFQGTSEIIDPQTGYLTIIQQDFVLPGKYGTDFAFTRIFSPEANMLEQPEIYFRFQYYEVDSGSVGYGVGTARDRFGCTKYEVAFIYDAQTSRDGIVVGNINHICRCENFDHGNNFIQTTNASPKSSDMTAIWDVESEIAPYEHQKDIFGLGLGWKLDGIPTINILDTDKYLDLGSKGIYKIESDGYLADKGGLKDLQVLSDTSYSYDNGKTSSYVLKSIDGSKWYFDSIGNPLAYKDKYNQYIWITYADGKISNIVDTLGRVIEFTHGNDLIIRIYESATSNQALQEWTYGLAPTIDGEFDKLIRVERPTGPDIVYGYAEPIFSYDAKYEHPNTNIEETMAFNLKYLALTSIQHPTSGTSYFQYAHKRVTERYDMVPTDIVTYYGINSATNTENKSKFSYGTNFTTRTLVDSLNQTVMTERWNFDNSKRMTSHVVTGTKNGLDRQSTEVSTAAYYYSGSSRLPYRITNTTSLSGEQIVTTQYYEWDTYGNLIKETDEAGRVTIYTYDVGEDKYNMLLEKKIFEEYSDNSKKGVVTEYELEDSGRNIISIKEYYGSKTVIGIDTYSVPAGEVPDKERPPYAFIWQSPGEVDYVSLTIGWTTCGWWIDNQYAIEYRKNGDIEWILYYLSPYTNGGLFAEKGTRTTTINLPGPEIYEIRVREIEGDAEIKSGSFARGPKYDRDSYLQRDFIYKTFEYEHPESITTFMLPPGWWEDPFLPSELVEIGNLVAVNVYPMNQETGIPETRTTYTYDLKWQAYVTEETTIYKDASTAQNEKTVKSTKQYDDLGRIVSEKVEEVGQPASTTSYGYDGLGRIIRIQNPPYDSLGNYSVTTVSYLDSQRKVETAVQENNQILSKVRETFDGLGRSIYTEYLDANNTWQFVSYTKYDSIGRVESVFDADFKEITFEYDSFDRKVKTILPDGSEAESWYASVNLIVPSSPEISLIPPSDFSILELGGWTKSEDGEGNPTYVGYDILGRITWTATNPKDNPQNGGPVWDMVWHEYDEYDRVTKIAINRTSSEWDVTEYEYEYNGQRTIFTSPLTMKLPGNTEAKYIYEYNSRGAKVKEYQENNPSSEITYVYDELGRLKQVQYPGKLEYVNISDDSFMPQQSYVTRRDDYYYDIYGLTKVESFINNTLDNRITISHNLLGWVTEETSLVDNTNYSFSYEYDALGNKLSMTYPDGDSVTYTYDELQRLTNIPGYFGNNNQQGFVYDNVGNLTDMYSANGIHTQYQYNDVNMVTSIDSDYLKLNYIYLSNGNISSITDSSTGAPVTLNYTYDRKGQLLTAQVNKASGLETVTYIYDGANNRISESWSDAYYPITYSYLPGSYLNSRVGETTSHYTWNQYGQLASKSSGISYMFSSKNQLTATLNDEQPIELYTYDALGRRLKVITSSEITLNFALGNDAGYEVKKEIGSSNITETKYISLNGTYLAKTVKENGGQEQKYFHHGDLVGSIRTITDIQGNLVANYEYEPFGLVTNINGIDEDTLGFTGKRLDGTGLSYFGARYYDAEIGRFISRDPAFDGRNWFVYCANSPLIYVDPTGAVMKLIGSYRDQTMMMWYIQTLTDDILGVKNGVVFIEQYKDNSAVIRVGGTSLIRQIIENTFTTEVMWGSLNTARPSYISGTTRPDWENSMNGKGTNAVVTLNYDQAFSLKIPMPIAGGHELIHGLRIMNGMVDLNKQRFDNPYAPNGFEDWLREEFITTGLYISNPITIKDFNGNIITENSLRVENRFYLRKSYDLSPK